MCPWTLEGAQRLGSTLLEQVKIYIFPPILSNIQDNKPALAYVPALLYSATVFVG